MQDTKDNQQDNNGAALQAELPAGWVWTTLGEICLKPQYGWTTSASQEGDIKLLRTTDITPGQINWEKVPFCKENPPEIEKYLLEDGDVVISRAGSVGFSHLVRKPHNAVFASYLIRFKSLINDDFFSHFLKCPLYWASISESSIGIAIPNVNATKLKQVSIPIPPLNEQHRIVTKIEELFTNLDAGVKELKNAKTQLQRYRQAVLKHAFEGKLTAEWREAHKDELEPAEVLLERIRKEREKGEKGKKRHRALPPPDVDELPEGWAWVTGDELFSFVTSGSRGWAKYYSDEGALFLRIGNLNHNTISLDLAQLKRVKLPENVEGKRTRVKTNDILISITADVGMIALVPKFLEESYINQHIALARPITCIEAAYVAWYFTSQENGQRQLLKLQRGATKMGLGLDDIRAVNIPLPSFHEQKRIVEEIEDNLSIADIIEKTLNQSLTQSQRLRQSILKRAFQGKLVPQDPNDESAEKLLERIRAEKQKQQRTTKAKNKNRKIG